ncbi:MAG: phosphatase PAP2 family protein [Thermoanaerobaculia bacterium]
MLPILLFAAVFLISWMILLPAEPLVRGSLARAAHFTTKFRHRDYLPVGVLLIIGAGLAAVVGDQFADLAELVVQKNATLQQIDQVWHDMFVYARSPGANRFFETMSILGGPVVMGALTGIIAVALVVRRRYRWAVYLVVTAGGGALLNMELKRYFARARPAMAQAIYIAQGYSFPSAHAMGSTVVAGGIAYLAVRTLHLRRQRAAAIAFAITFVLAVAASRVYLGVHWISDIAAGISGGLLWLMTTTLGYETLRRIRRIRKMNEEFRISNEES